MWVPIIVFPLLHDESGCSSPSQAEWGAWVSTCHPRLKQAAGAHPATVDFQCWPPPLSPQAEKFFEPLQM